MQKRLILTPYYIAICIFVAGKKYRGQESSGRRGARGGSGIGNRERESGTGIRASFPKPESRYRFFFILPVSLSLMI